MSRTRTVLLFLIVPAVVAGLTSLTRAHARTNGGGAAVVSPVLFGMQAGTLQRATATPTPDARQKLCTSRRADWERNRTPLSLSLGFIIFLMSLYLLTRLRFKNTVTRVIISEVAAVVVGLAVMAVIAQDAQKVCLDPPGFFGALSAPMLWWTLAGSVGTLLIIVVLRWLVVGRRFRQELPTT